jgi:hypothetical protein
MTFPGEPGPTKIRMTARGEAAPVMRAGRALEPDREHRDEHDEHDNDRDQHEMMARRRGRRRPATRPHCYALSRAETH